jgi:hypothetical protein
VKSGEAKTVREAREGKPPRQLSGALPGGRLIAQAGQYQERKGGQAFSLRINFDAVATPPGIREEMIRRLEEILAKLKSAH